MKHEYNEHHFGDRATRSPTTRQDDYAKKYTGAHGTKATGGPWPESPGQGGTTVKAPGGSANIKGANRIAP